MLHLVEILSIEDFFRVGRIVGLGVEGAAQLWIFCFGDAALYGDSRIYLREHFWLVFMFDFWEAPPLFFARITHRLAQALLIIDQSM